MITMTKRLILIAAVLSMIAGCSRLSESRINPFNWFGDGQEAETLAPVDARASADPRPLVSEIAALTIEQTPGGAILRAVGMPPEQGWYDAALVSDTDGEPVDGILTYSLRAFPPVDPSRVSTTQSRQLVVARYISSVTLANVREIRVTAQLNSRAVRR